MPDCSHSWVEGELLTPFSEEAHPCLYCEQCETLVDLIYEPDPREV